MATEKIDVTDLFDKFLTTYKPTHVRVNGQPAQIECSRLWHEIKKIECCYKIWSPKTYAAVENECKKARERFNRSFFYKSGYKERWAIYQYVIITPIFIHQSFAGCLNTAWKARCLKIPHGKFSKSDMETHRFLTPEKRLFRAIKMSFSLFLICIFNFHLR